MEQPRSTGLIVHSKGREGSSALSVSILKFIGEPFQNTSNVVLPFAEQSTAQSVCPGFRKEPLMTLLGFCDPNGWESCNPGSEVREAGLLEGRGMLLVVAALLLAPSARTGSSIANARAKEDVLTPFMLRPYLRR